MKKDKQKIKDFHLLFWMRGKGFNSWMKVFNSFRTLVILSLSLIIISLWSCSYSFTGAKIDENINSVSIQTFENNSPITLNASLPQTFTEKLRDKFLSQSRLKLVTQKGDIDVKGVITNFNFIPLNIQGNDQAAQNRLTLSMTVKMSSEKNEQYNWEKSFTNFVDFPSSTTYSSVESQLITEVSDKLTQDIFTSAFANW